MQLEGFETVVDARRELSNHGYLSGFSSPGRPSLWVKPGAQEHGRKAIAQRKGETTWHIVPYPEPASCRRDQLAELQARDRIAGVTEDGGMVTADDDDLAFLN